MAESTLIWTELQKPSADFVREDPLGFGHIEGQIADWLWPGLTQRTTRAGYFVVVTYGIWVAEQVARRYGLPTTDDSIRALFQRWERLWAMAVCAMRNGQIPPEDALRGKEGATAAYRAGHGSRLPLDYQLISRQRELGALGAYLPSLRAHSLVAEDTLRVTPLGWDLAQWMWDDPPARASAYDEYVVAALDPRNTVIPQQVGRVSLMSLAKRAALSQVSVRPKLQSHLFNRLLGGGGRGAFLPQVAEVLMEARGTGVEDTRELLEGIVTNRWRAGCSPDLRDLASFAVVFGDVSMSFRAVFDRMYGAVLSEGDEAAWGECVRRALPDGEVEVLNAQVDLWRRLDQPERVAALPPHAANFERVARRMNTQNRYHTFESILLLHEQAQRVLGGGAGWFERKGDAVLLRQTGYERWALEGTTWSPGYRMNILASMLGDLGRFH